MSKHTPGPWRDEHGSIKASNNYEVAALTAPFHMRNEITEANAHLIVAAPEMYEALERALMALEECGFQKHSGEMGCIRAALAKAEGRS